MFDPAAATSQTGPLAAERLGQLLPRYRRILARRLGGSVRGGSLRRVSCGKHSRSQSRRNTGTEQPGGVAALLRTSERCLRLKATVSTDFGGIAVTRSRAKGKKRTRISSHAPSRNAKSDRVRSDAQPADAPCGTGLVAEAARPRSRWPFHHPRIRRTLASGDRAVSAGRRAHPPPL